MNQRYCSNTAHALIRCAVAGIAFAATSAMATALTPAQEKQVKVGMTMEEVRNVAGKPDRVVRMRYSAGPTWRYETKVVPHIRYFEVDFDAANKVMWIEVHEPTED